MRGYLRHLALTDDSLIGRYQDASQCYGMILDIDPDNIEALFSKGDSLYALQVLGCLNVMTRHRSWSRCHSAY